MTHLEALEFIKDLSFKPNEIWADLGAGSGTFTKAIAELLGPTGLVHAVDKSTQAITLPKAMKTSIAPIQVHNQDFTKPLGLGNLDSIFMANALHFIRNQERLLRQLSLELNPKGKLVILEYDIRRGNPWVPFPVRFERLEHLAEKLALPAPKKVATRPSRYHQEMYLAVIELLD